MGETLQSRCSEYIKQREHSLLKSESRSVNVLKCVQTYRFVRFVKGVIRVNAGGSQEHVSDASLESIGFGIARSILGQACFVWRPNVLLLLCVDFVSCSISKMGYLLGSSYLATNTCLILASDLKVLDCIAINQGFGLVSGSLDFVDRCVTVPCI
ncbi:hypothetical protein J1N35_034181 [Gossypium stocksii]|uniref:Uncharacterized protein n=1 Tax=Gossypium stocksii TaxID=47602 RepID=A0A9D3URI1_9ROSI|nr:hypothetical protein J1N35_034181 [Gossypium stocksii]